MTVQNYAVVVDGVLKDFALATPEVAAEREGWVPAGNGRKGDLWDGEAFTPPPQPIPDTSQFEAALYAHFDTAAQDEGKDEGRPGWENRHTLYARTAFPDGQWYALAVSFAQWMDVCEVQALQLLGAVQAGQVEAPASVAAFLATLPAWVKP